MKSLELITTGTEIIVGEVLNSNASWLARACTELGLRVTRHTTVGDDRAAIGVACREAAQRADLVIVTGGMGATSDDVTLAAAAAAFGRTMKFHPDLWARIEAAFAQRGRECTPNNRRMAEMPEGAVPLFSPAGVATAVRVQLDQTLFFFLPGVPSMVEWLFAEQVAPWFRAQGWVTPREQRVLRCFGMPESAIGHRIEALALHDVDIGYQIIFPETLVKIFAAANDARALAQRLDTAEAQVRECLGDVVYGAGQASFAAVVGSLLRDRQASVAIAESCTGGMIGHVLTNEPGASRYLDRSIVCYSNAAKTAMLQIPSAMIAEHGAVSATVARAMAQAVRVQAGTTYGLAVTGIAGPDGGTTEHPVGTAYIALATPTHVWDEHLVYPHERQAYKTFVTYTALNLLRRQLLNKDAIR